MLQNEIKNSQEQGKLLLQKMDDLIKKYDELIKKLEQHVTSND